MLPRWKWIDHFVRYWSDPYRRQFFKRYEHMPDHELDRKRNVSRENIRKGHRVEHYKRKHEVIWAIQSRRERKQHKRARRAEARALIGLIGVPTLVGLLIILWNKLERVLSSVLDMVAFGAQVF